ncbi:MAG TPA: GatB/YqeY domain-containing protein [Anaerolineaceae bacterium]|nr:GatB/YqeY domain-containing protein [Anaerolineaceae bacterium]
MELKKQLENALKDAMRANDDVTRRTIRMALSSIKLAEVEKGQPLDDLALMGILQKEIKMRNEAIQEARQANRPDLEAASQVEITVLQSFLPQPMSDAELNEFVQSIITELNASGTADMGRVIKAVIPRVQGRAPGDKVSQVVRTLLQK